ncbi:MAG TPA: DUF4411 family protein [Candidatus Tectomicrobia bacterium]|nr:DUF4411 family protein [Candidatus Tectomicrobia bacterium]
MTGKPIYVLDANVFIESSRRYYAFDLAPAFWQALVHHASNGRLLSIDRVKQELERGKDDLAHWVDGSFDGWFASTTQDDVLDVYRQIVAWVQRQRQYLDAAKVGFINGADGWLIAYAKAKGCGVVTHEQPAPDAKRKIPIPSVCRAFNVTFIDSFAMLRALGVKLG